MVAGPTGVGFYSLLAVTPPLAGPETPPGTIETHAVETIDNDQASVLLGVLPPG